MKELSMGGFFGTLGGQLPPNPPTAIWVGLSGRPYPFFVGSMSGAWPQMPGVYIFAALPVSGSWRALYVGQTLDFSRRMQEHKSEASGKWRSAINLGAIAVHTMVQASEVLRLQIEGDLIRSLRPPLNDTLGLGDLFAQGWR